MKTLRLRRLRKSAIIVLDCLMAQKTIQSKDKKYLVSGKNGMQKRG